MNHLEVIIVLLLLLLVLSWFIFLWQYCATKKIINFLKSKIEAIILFDNLIESSIATICEYYNINNKLLLELITEARKNESKNHHTNR